MDFEVFAVVVTSVVGSTGLASLITGGIQLSRAARLKKATTDMAALAAMHDPGSKEHAAVKLALKVLTLDLVALRLVRVGARIWWRVFAVVLALGLTVALQAEQMVQIVERASFPIPLAVAVAASYVLLMVGGFLFLLSRRRERLVAFVLEDGEFDEEHIIARLPPLQSYHRRMELRQLWRTRERRMRAKRAERRREQLRRLCRLVGLCRRDRSSGRETEGEFVNILQQEAARK